MMQSQHGGGGGGGNSGGGGGSGSGQPEFAMHSDDFPALGGAGGPSPHSQSQSLQQLPPQMQHNHMQRSGDGYNHKSVDPRSGGFMVWLDHPSRAHRLAL